MRKLAIFFLPNQALYQAYLFGVDNISPVRIYFDGVAKYRSLTVSGMVILVIFRFLGEILFVCSLR